MDGRGLQRAAVLGVLSRHSWWVSRAASSFFHPVKGRHQVPPGHGSRSDNGAKRSFIALLLQSGQGSLTWALNIPDPGKLAAL